MIGMKTTNPKNSLSIMTELLLKMMLQESAHWKLSSYNDNNDKSNDDHHYLHSNENGYKHPWLHIALFNSYLEIWSKVTNSGENFRYSKLISASSQLEQQINMKT